MNAEQVPTTGRTSEAIADLLDEFGLPHSSILLQPDLMAAHRSMVTKVLVGQLTTVQLNAGDLQNAAAQSLALPPARLSEGLETLAARRNQARVGEARVGEATPRPVLHLQDGGMQ